MPPQLNQRSGILPGGRADPQRLLHLVGAELGQLDGDVRILLVERLDHRIETVGGKREQLDRDISGRDFLRSRRPGKSGGGQQQRDGQIASVSSGIESSLLSVSGLKSGRHAAPSPFQVDHGIGSRAVIGGKGEFKVSRFRRRKAGLRSCRPAHRASATGSRQRCPECNARVSPPGRHRRHGIDGLDGAARCDFSWYPCVSSSVPLAFDPRHRLRKRLRLERGLEEQSSTETRYFVTQRGDKHVLAANPGIVTLRPAMKAFHLAHQPARKIEQMQSDIHDGKSFELGEVG